MSKKIFSIRIFYLLFDRRKHPYFLLERNRLLQLNRYNYLRDERGRRIASGTAMATAAMQIPKAAIPTRNTFEEVKPAARLILNKRYHEIIVVVKYLFVEGTSSTVERSVSI